MWFWSLSRVACLAVAIATTAVGVASAASFSVDPISVTLKHGGTSATIAVVNQSGSKLRLQVTGFSWQQSTAGEMQLAATDDLVFFPQLLTLDPGETKRIRVGVTAANGLVEKTYRVFMEELPSLDSVLLPQAGAQLTIRMKIGVPIFVSPIGATTVSGTVSNARIHDGSIQFDVINTGNKHFSVSDVAVVATNKAGVQAFAQNVTGWYVLAGGTRHFVVPLPKGRCDEISELKINVKTDTGSFKNAFSNLRKDCPAAAHR